MSEEPRDLILPILREMREEMNKRFNAVDEKLSRLGQNVEEINAAVATLTVSNRHIRADVAQILAESGDYARRLKRIEDHLGLPPIN
jgi:uncharacterized protein YPO0396